MSYGDVNIKSNSRFLKIESGVPHDIRLLSESPEERVVHGFGKEEVECLGDGCLPCKDPENQAKQRFTAEIYDHTIKRQLTWEFGAAIAKQLKAIDTTMAEEGRKITSIDLKVEAQGEKMSKKYMVTPRMSAKPLPDGVIPF
jgi:hypothetical protein